MWHIWLIMAGIFLIIEIITVGFLIFWLSIGSLFAMVTSFFTDNIIIQTSVFVISSAMLIFATKPFVKKFASIGKPLKTNVDSIIGKTGLVTAKIDSINSSGQIKIGGELWSAVSVNKNIIPVGTEIEVTKIQGVKAVVKPLQTIN